MICPLGADFSRREIDSIALRGLPVRQTGYS